MLVSGFQSQGPPPSLHPAAYMRYISLAVQTSRDGQDWADCCGPSDSPPNTFYADDRSDEVGAVRNHRSEQALLQSF